VRRRGFHQFVEELPTKAETDPGDSQRIFFFMSPEHVPAPQLASPAGEAFGAPAFFTGILAAGLVAAAGVALALTGGELDSAAAVGALVAAVAAAVVAGAGEVAGRAAGGAAAAGGTAPAFVLAAMPEQLLAEHDA
jgi:hypothetical protein